MEERDQGIIMRVRPLTETSLIVQWLAREHGLISTVAKGARRPKSTFMGKLDLHYTAHFTFQRSRRSELHTLREIQLDRTHEGLRRDLGWLNQAAYAGALIEYTSERDTPLPGQYQLLLEFLGQLTKTPPECVAIFRFELQLLDLLGLTPEWQGARVGAGSKAILENLRRGLETNSSVSQAQADEIAHFLCGFFDDLNPRLQALRQTALLMPQSGV